MKKRSWKLAFGFVFGLVCSTVSAGVQITDLGTDNEQSSAYAVNDLDYVVGSYWAGTGGPSHSFLAHDGQMTQLHALDSQYLITGGAGINNAGQISSGVLAPNGIYYPATYDVKSGKTHILGALGGANEGFAGTAVAINNLGQAAGYAYLANGDYHAFFHDGSLMRDLGCTPNEFGCYSYAAAINDMGQVSGGSNRGAFLYSNGVMTNINPFASTYSTARGMNNRGDVVGEYWSASRFAYRAFVYSNGTVKDIGGVPYAMSTVPFDINDQGQIVGAILIPPYNGCRECPPRETHAFVYENGALKDLNSLLPSRSDWELLYAFAINNRGHIVGYGLRHGQYRAFLLSR